MFISMTWRHFRSIYDLHHVVIIGYNVMLVFNIKTLKRNWKLEKRRPIINRDAIYEYLVLKATTINYFRSFD